MARKKQQQQRTNNEFELPKDKAATLADQLGGDVLAKLKAAKKDMLAQEKVQEEERIAKAAFDRKQREKNMSFEELLDQYGNKGSKF
ncbi:YqkE family protein [Solibacillus cecembensis]|uniref:YqkE family protein n=1 Tax=Solibacillus cecembensis TaxID=459347 RepID=UPI003D062B58